MDVSYACHWPLFCFFLEWKLLEGKDVALTKHSWFYFLLQGVWRQLDSPKRVEQLEAMDVNFLLFSNAFLFCVFAIFLSSSSSSGPPRAHCKRPCVLGGGVLVVSLVSPSFSVENVSLSRCLRVRSGSSSCSPGVLLDTQDLWEESSRAPLLQG